MLARLAVMMLLCAGCQERARGPGYEGLPLFTVNGQLTLVGQGNAPRGPIRLAVAWYPDERSTSAPRALVPQEVQYQGTFPLNYAFSFFSVPPEGALSDYTQDGVTTRAAFGVLIAYEDLNGNGQLDPIAAGGSPIDDVLGTSIGDDFNGGETAARVYVAYVDGAPPAQWVEYVAGYNLWQSGRVVPPSTRVTIPLQQTNELNFFVCEEFISNSSYGYDLPCNIAPTGGVRVIGNVYGEGGVAGASLRVTDGVKAITTARVEVNGVSVPYVAGLELYSSFDGSISLVAPGRNTVRVTVPGQAPRVFELEAPGDFTLDAPSALGSRLLAGSALEVRWSRASGASFYQLGANTSQPPFARSSVELVHEVGQAQRRASLTGFTEDDFYQLQVVAFAPGYFARGLGGSMVNVSTSRQAYVDVITAAGLRVEGYATQVSYQGSSSASVWVEAFDGLTPLSTAVVQLNGEPLTYDPQWQRYTTQTATLSPGGPANFVVSASGRAPVRTSVSLPGDFTVSAVPSTHSANAPLTVSWSSSSDATSYRVYVSNAAGELLFDRALLETSLAVPPLLRQEMVSLSVTAQRETAGERHVVGSVQKAFDVTLGP